MAYLFVHFTGEHEDGEQVYFSVSRDGLFWDDLNRGAPVLRSNIGEGGVRDPFLFRDSASGKFRLLATDLCIHRGKGWGTAQFAGSRSLILWESDDLIHWSEPRSVTLAPENAGCAWAPEAIFDEERGETMVFWASMVQYEGDPAPKQRIFRSYTKDFASFTPAELYLEREGHVIDMTIVRDGGWYYRFSMNNGTLFERARRLNDPFERVPSPFLDALTGVEGPECYRLPDGRWCLIEDRYARGLGYLPLVTDELASGIFAEAERYDLGRSRKRHGGVLAIQEEEYERLRNAFGGEA